MSWRYTCSCSIWHWAVYWWKNDVLSSHGISLKQIKTQQSQFHTFPEIFLPWCRWKLTDTPFSTIL
jgi:uncharacterized protein involved in tolerance to divalent cations